MGDLAQQRAGVSGDKVPKVDLVVFPKFTFTGYNVEWTGDEFKRVA